MGACCVNTAASLATLCYCSVCPNGNTTCRLKPNGQCFAALELEGDEWVLSHGCLAPVDEEGGIILQVQFAFPPPAPSVCSGIIWLGLATVAGACLPRTSLVISAVGGRGRGTCKPDCANHRDVQIMLIHYIRICTE